MVTWPLLLFPFFSSNPLSFCILFPFPHSNSEIFISCTGYYFPLQEARRAPLLSDGDGGGGGGVENATAAAVVDGGGGSLLRRLFREVCYEQRTKFFSANSPADIFAFLFDRSAVSFWIIGASSPGYKTGGNVRYFWWVTSRDSFFRRELASEKIRIDAFIFQTRNWGFFTALWRFKLSLLCYMLHSAILPYAELFYAILCYTALCYATLGYALWYAVLSYAMCHVIMWCAVLFYAMLCCAMQSQTIWTVPKQHPVNRDTTIKIRFPPFLLPSSILKQYVAILVRIPHHHCELESIFSLSEENQ